MEVQLQVASCVTLLKIKAREGWKWFAHSTSARGQTLSMLTKHLFNIHRGLFLEFIFSSLQVPMLSLLVHLRAAFTSVMEHLGNTDKIRCLSCDKTLFTDHTDANKKQVDPQK